MNVNLDLSKYLVPILGTACIGGGLLVASGMRTPVALDAGGDAEPMQVRVPGQLELAGYVPTMEEVLAKHLFVPERMATGENAFPDLLVKGVYVGETQRNAVFSLKSKPEANLRVWQGDEEAALAQVVDERDPRKPISEFLQDWHIRSIDFGGVTLEHVFTGEKETYAVDYTPVKHAKDSAQNGYGQGLATADAPGGEKAPATTRAPGSGQPARGAVPPGGPQAIAGRIGQYMQQLSPEQRQQFMQQLQKQNAAAKNNGDGGANDQKKKSGGSSGDRKNYGGSSDRGRSNGDRRSR
jgi:hypothetical protein